MPRPRGVIAEGAADQAWREGHRVLSQRVASLPAALRAAAAPIALDLAAIRGSSFVTTGLGSSAAHARFLAVLLRDAGSAARSAALSEVGARRATGRRETLIVFSQGLSPNARLAFQALDQFRAAIFATAVAEAAPDARPTDKQRFLAELRRRGVQIVHLIGAEEYETLIRIVGPMAGYASAVRLAEALGAAPSGLDVDAVCKAVASATDRLDREHPDVHAADLEANLTFLATGAYAECIENLRFKVLEGMFLPMPPVWDPLEIAHGPFQQAHGRATTFLALERPDAPFESERIDRLGAMLVAGRHRLVRLRATLPGHLAVFEHEALMNALLLRFLEERQVDQIDWPGKGADAPLYAIGSDVNAEIASPARPGLSLESLTWPDVERLVANGVDTAVLPLGSTEQHGFHLPMATDSAIAQAVAERFCGRFPETLRLPTLALGCADEHLSFPGTLSLRDETFAAVLQDIARSVAAHGLKRLVVFSAHGGNERALAEVDRSMQASAPGLQVIVMTGLAELTAVLHAESARHGVAPAASGQHAGELETSILLEIAPGAVRRDRLRAGLVDTALPPSELFYPDLRRNAADGTVGDPRGADGARAERYLDAWVDVLADRYLRAKNLK